MPHGVPTEPTRRMRYEFVGVLMRGRLRRTQLFAAVPEPCDCSNKNRNPWLDREQLDSVAPCAERRIEPSGGAGAGVQWTWNLECGDRAMHLRGPLSWQVLRQHGLSGYGGPHWWRAAK